MKWNKVLAMTCAAAMTTGMFATTAFAEETYDHEAIEKEDDITITMMVSGTAYENDFETEQLPALIKEKWPNVTLEVQSFRMTIITHH